MKKKIKPQECIDLKSKCGIRKHPNLCPLPFVCTKFCEGTLNGYCVPYKKKFVKVFVFKYALLHHTEIFEVANPQSLIEQF